MIMVMDDADEDLVVEIDELGELVIDLRTTLWRPAPPEVASHHLDLMAAAAKQPGARARPDVEGS
jgi:hypothetical protein